MIQNYLFYLLLFVYLVLTVGCSPAGGVGKIAPTVAEPTPSATMTVTAPTETLDPPALNQQGNETPPNTQAAYSKTQSTPAATETAFEVGKELTIQHLREVEITGSDITFEEELETTADYTRHLVSYLSEGYKIYGLLTIPRVEPPEGGFKAVIFNHGYVPPVNYRTTEGYTAYVDYLAKNGFVVFKIDYRGHGQSQGVPNGTYFSPGYTIDSISALKSLQKMEIIDLQGIGMWGHSMAGNLVLRAMLVEPDVKAGVIWAGAVYSYDDFEKFRIDDNTYRPPVNQDGTPRARSSQEIFDTHGRPNSQADYWRAVSLTENIELLDSPLQLHHAQDDPVVNIGYSLELAAVLQQNNKDYEFYNYEGGGHNIVSPYFEQAMQRTVEFFRNNL